MRAYLKHPDVRPALQLIARRGANPGVLCCLVGFSAEHQAYFDQQGRALRRVFAEVLTLKRRERQQVTPQCP